MIIYGLGNNEDKYLNTKHNIGRKFIENIALHYNLSFKKINPKSGEGFYYAKNDDLYLVFSQGYMNTSGEPLKNFMNYFKLKPEKLFVIQDDSDQNTFSHKLLLGGGNAGHKGIKSIQNVLSIKDFYRLKIGIRPSQNRLKSEHFVLNRFESGEELYCKKLSRYFIENIECYYLNPSKFQTIVNSFK